MLKACVQKWPGNTSRPHYHSSTKKVEGPYRHMDKHLPRDICGCIADYAYPSFATALALNEHRAKMRATLGAIVWLELSANQWHDEPRSVIRYLADQQWIRQRQELIDEWEREDLEH